MDGMTSRWMWARSCRVYDGCNRPECWRRCRSKPLLTHLPTTPWATRVAVYPHACWVRGRNKWRSRRSARWLTPVSAAASLTVGISLVQPKARPISLRGRRSPQPGVCPDLV